jgi:hypothetical protein
MAAGPWAFHKTNNPLSKYNKEWKKNLTILRQLLSPILQI